MYTLYNNKKKFRKKKVINSKAKDLTKKREKKNVKMIRERRANIKNERNETNKIYSSSASSIN